MTSSVTQLAQRRASREASSAGSDWTHPQVSGGDIEKATPDPIPNSEVKLLGADGTARATWWESRTPPGFSLNLRTGIAVRRFFFVFSQPFCVLPAGRARSAPGGRWLREGHSELPRALSRMFIGRAGPRRTRLGRSFPGVHGRPEKERRSVSDIGPLRAALRTPPRGPTVWACPAALLLVVAAGSVL